MNIEIANNLVKLRKEHGYSQENLAEKLNVSRQAISKWERAEASPDTDNLIELSKIYGVTIDEIINSHVDNNIKENNNDDFKNSVHVSLKDVDVYEKGRHVHVDLDGIHVENNLKEVNVNKQTIKEYTKNHKKALIADGILFGITSLIVTIAYILIGTYFTTGWEIGWNLFYLIPIVTSLSSAIIEKRMSNFAFPVLAAAIYTTIGMIWGIWHPSWIVFLFIPIYYSIATPIDKKHPAQEPDEFIKSKDIEE